MTRSDPSLAMIREELTRLLRLLERIEPRPTDVPTDIWMGETEVLVRFEVPGAAPDSLRLSGHRCFLELSGTRASFAPEGGGRFLIAERPAGHFRKSVELPAPVDMSQVDAHFADGIMTVRAPRVPERRGERRPLNFTVNE
ncbi:MAG: Hsp20/alpha crystallin family protein [Deltaproteobacteria bacterium]|nr:Hsp20/alpha crystallin family protein [Deltaproteobacteria bacterium]